MELLRKLLERCTAVDKKLEQIKYAFLNSVAHSLKITNKYVTNNNVLGVGHLLLIIIQSIQKVKRRHSWQIYAPIKHINNKEELRKLYIFS